MQKLPLRFVFITTFWAFLIGFISQTGFSLTGGRHIAPNETYRKLFQEGKIEAALTEIDELMAARPHLKEHKSYRYYVWLSDRAEIHFYIGNVDRAIEDVKEVIKVYAEPVFIHRLATYLRYTGRMEEYKNLLGLTAQSRWSFHEQEKNFLAMGQLAEMMGENPKRLLSSFYDAMHKQFPEFTAGFIGAGELSLRHHAYDLAEQHLKKALAIDPESPQALAGLAECYFKAKDPRLGEILETLFHIDPNNRRGIAIRVEQHLDLGETKKALEFIESVLAVNPNHLRMRSFQAAALFLNDKLKAMRELQEEVLDFNPRCSQVYYLPGKIASRHYRFKEGVEFQRQALSVNPDDLKARTLYALDLLRLGKDQVAREQLELVFEKDPYHVHVYNLLNLMDSIDKFAILKKDPFVLQLPGKEEPLIADAAYELLLEAYNLFQEKYDMELETPIHVQIFDDHDDFMVRSLGLPGQIGFQGICFGSLVTMDSPSARPKHTMNWHSVLWHEFVHVVTLQKTNSRMPRWLSEGISVYEEKQKSTAWGQKMDIQYKAILEKEGIPGLADLETYFVHPKSSLHLMLGYFMAAEFVTFYTERFGIDTLVDALERIGGGADTLDALASTADIALKQMDTQFETYLKPRLQPYKNLPNMGKPEIAKLDELDMLIPQSNTMWIHRESPFTNAMREGLQAMENSAWDKAEEAFSTAHELFPDFTAESAPLKQLIEIYKQQNNQEKLKETLHKEIAWDPTDYTARKELLNLQIFDNQWHEAIATAQKALAIDPFDLSVYQSLITAYEKLGQEEKAVAITRQLEAMDKEHRTRYRIKRIELLQESAQWEQAKVETVKLLEDYPHNWEAQQMLLSLVEREEKPQNEKYEIH